MPQPRNSCLGRRIAHDRLVSSPFSSSSLRCPGRQADSDYSGVCQVTVGKPLVALVCFESLSERAAGTGGLRGFCRVHARASYAHIRVKGTSAACDRRGSIDSCLLHVDRHPEPTRNARLLLLRPSVLPSLRPKPAESFALRTSRAPIPNSRLFKCLRVSGYRGWDFVSLSKRVCHLSSLPPPTQQASFRNAPA